jgi:hypothetical protein
MESIDLSKIRIKEEKEENLEQNLQITSEKEMLQPHEPQGQFRDLNEFKFPQRRQMSREEILSMSRKEIRIATNYCRLNFNHLKELGLVIYSITIRSTLGEVLEPSMVKTLLVKMNRSQSFKDVIVKNFKFALQSGNHIYGVPFNMDFDYLHFYLFYKPPDCYLISPLEYESIEEENKKFYFKVKIEILMKIGEEEEKINPSKKEALKRFMNIFIGKKMKMLDYLKSVESRKTIFYIDFLKYKKEKIYIDDDKFFCPGYQITSNYYENEIMMMKVIPKFRLVRHSTYLDYYDYIRNLHKFENDCIGGKGLKAYDQMKVRIDGVEFLDPKKMYFEKVQIGEEPKKINLLQYYQERWNIKVEAGEQMLLFQYDRKRNYQTGEVTEKKLYFFPHLVYIVGLLPGETINAKNLKFSPQDKYQKFLDVVKSIKMVKGRSENFSSPSEEKIYGNNMNYEPFSTTALVLQQPVLEFKSSKITPNEFTGEFNNVMEPYKNTELSKWLVLLYDCSQDEGGRIFEKLQEAAVGLNMKIGIPDVKDLKDITKSDEFREYLDCVLKDYFEVETKKNNENDKYQMIVFFTSKKRSRNYYSIFKDCFNHSKFDIPSQVVIKENALKRGFSYHTNLLIQMWAKRELTVWRIKMDPILQDTVVISYAVTYNKLLGKSLTTVGITTNKYYNQMYFKSEYGEIQGGTSFSTNLQKLIKNCLRESILFLDGKVYKNIIIYREGLNESGINTVMNLEFEALYKGVEEVYLKEKAGMPEICLIFVNRICDTKLFQSFSEELMEQSRGHEDFSRHNRRNYQNEIENVPVGTLVDHSITSQNIWEFYLNSTWANQGTNNPTHYIVGYNSTTFQNSVIYNLTYKLTYYYYNTSKPVRFPGPLHRVIRRNKFIIENISGNIKNLAPYIDISL